MQAEAGKKRNKSNAAIHAGNTARPIHARGSDSGGADVGSSHARQEPEARNSVATTLFGEGRIMKSIITEPVGGSRNAKSMPFADSTAPGLFFSRLSHQR